ncbi:AI-2E family transporter [Yoonia sp. 2307UL14-13]
MAILATLTALAVARLFVVPVFLAMLLALVFSPLCRWLRRRGIPEPISATVITVFLLAAIIASTAILAIPVSSWIENAPEMAREAERKLKSIVGIANAVIEASEEVEKAAGAQTGNTNQPVEVIIDDGGPLTTVALGAPLIVAQTIFVLILMLFILASGSLFYERLVGIMPTLSDKKRALQIAYDVEHEVSRYLFSITLINAGLGMAIGLAMAALGMPNPAIFGLLAFGMNYVPFLGAVVGIALSFAVALVSLPTGFDAAIVAVVYFALTSIEGQFVTPWFVGRQLRLNTVVILIAVAFWAWLWSIMGMIMAVPLLVTFRVLCRHIVALKPFEDFLSAREN